MSSVPNPPEDDVHRLLKQMDMAAFGFKSFNRPGREADAGDYDTAASTEAADAPSPARVPPAPATPPAALATSKVERPAAAPPPRGAAAVDEAFGRLIRKNEPRARRNPAFRLNLPLRPRIAEVARGASGELLITDVLNRLYRLSAPKVSLVRPRGEA